MSMPINTQPMDSMCRKLSSRNQSIILTLIHIYSSTAALFVTEKKKKWKH